MKNSMLLVWLWAVTLHAQVASPPSEVGKYHELLRKRPQAGTLFERFQDAWLADGTREGLRDFLKAQTTTAGATAADHQLFALFLARQGEDMAAVVALDAALKLQPVNAEALLEKARAQTRLLIFEAALTSLKSAANSAKDESLRVEIARMQGRALLRLSRNDDALKLWQELATGRPDDLDLAEEVVELMADEGLYAEAAAQAEALVKKTAAGADLMTRRLRLGDLLLRADKRDAALSVFEAVFEQSGQDSWVEGDVLTRMEQPFRREDDIEGLKKHLEKLHGTHAQRPALTLALAQVLADLGEADPAVKLVTALLTRTPGRRDLQERFVGMLERLERFAEATAQMQMLVEQNADDKELLIRLATLQERQKETQAAQIALDRYLKKAAGKDAKAPEHDHLRVARLFESWEMKEAAARAYTDLAAAHAESVSAKEALAHFYHRSDAHDKALEIWRLLAKTGGIEDLLRIGQALMSHARQKEALELLVARKDEFAAQPRYLALLSQLATTLDDHANAMLWARQRLTLIKDHASVPEAVRMAQLAIQDAEAAKTVIAELEKQAQGISIPNRCLLAALLDEEERTEDADQVLQVPSAALDDRLMLGAQRVRLLETRAEWSRAADVIAEMLKLPGGQTSEHARRLVQAYHRALANDKALAAIPEWKKLSPGAVGPWLEESALYLEQGKETASLDVLRQAARKFEDDRQVLGTLAESLARAGRTEDARRAYVSLYEQTEDIQTRLRLLGPLTEMSRAEGRLPQLIEEFETRQRQNRGSAAPWMALAEIHRATNNDEERRRCLYEASRRRPKDLVLLSEIARCEEESGLTKDALRTLEAAALLDKTSGTRQKIAQLMIDSGDDEAGYRLLFELAGGADADARALEKMADTMCEHGDWARAVRFLKPLLPRYADDYRLRYLLATALEEEGREQEAAAAFTELLGMHAEMPEVAAIQSQQLISNYQAPASFSVGGNYQLPDGAVEWMQLPGVAGQAYEHRQKQSNGGMGGMSFRSSPPAVATTHALPRGWVTQPTSVTTLSAMSLYHLIEIGQGMTASDKESLAAKMSGAGIRDAALILEVPVYQGSFGIPPELLAKHSDHAALHAVWLVSSRYYGAQDDDSMKVLQRCMALFKNSNPTLAWLAGMRALSLGGTEGTALGREAIALAESFPGADEMTMSALISALNASSRGLNVNGDSPIVLPNDIKDALFKLGHKWLELSYEQIAASNSYWSAAYYIGALAAADRWEELAVELERENTRQLDLLKKQKGKAKQRINFNYAMSSSRLQPQLLQPMWNGLDVSSSVATIIESLRRINNEMIYFDGTSLAPPEDEEAVRVGLQRVLAALKTPGLKVLMQVRLGDHAAVAAAIAEMLGGSELRADHWCFAAWAAQQARDWPRVVECLQKASALSPSNMTDNALLFAAQQASAEDHKKMREALQAIYARLNVPNMQQYEFQQLVSMMRSTGFEKEAEELQAKETARRAKPASRAVLAAVNPYSTRTSRSSNGGLDPKVEKLIATGQQEAAFPEILRAMRPLARQWFDSANWSNAQYPLRQMVEGLEKKTSKVAFVQWLATRSEVGWREMVEHAALLEFLNKDAEALKRYQAATKLNPRAWQARIRAAMLLAGTDVKDAAALLAVIPHGEMGQRMNRLAQECQQSDDNRTFENRLSTVRLVTEWIDGLAAEKRRLDPQLAGVLMNLPQYVQSAEYREDIRFDALNSTAPETQKMTEESKKAKAALREAHDALCKAMLRFPMLAEGGFAPLAGMALRDKVPLDELEKLAREALELKGWFQRAAPAMMYWNGSSNSRFGGQNQIAMPHPEDILVLAAAKRGEFDKIEQELAPLITKAKGSRAAKQALAYAELFRAGNDSFTKASGDWLKSMSPRPDAGAGAEIVRIWTARKLTAPIHDFFIERLKAQRGNINTEELRQYVQTLDDGGNTKDATDFLRRVRELWVGSTPEKRQEALAKHAKDRQAMRSSGGYSFSRGNSQTFSYYIQLHRTLLENNLGCTAGLPLLIEDGMLGELAIMEQLSSYLTPDALIHGPTEKLVALMETLQMLAEAPKFHAWFSGSERSYTMLSRYLEALNGTNDTEARERFIKALAARKQSTFGMRLVLALIDPSSETRRKALGGFISEHGAELAKLSPPAREEVHALFRRRVGEYPGFLNQEQRKHLGPLEDAEVAVLLKSGDQILQASSWADTAMDEYNSQQSVPKLLSVLAAKDRSKAVQVLEKVISLLKGTQNHAQNAAQGSSPVFSLLQNMGRAPQLMNEVLAIAAREKAPSSWLSNYAYSLSSDNQLRSTAHVLAIFTGTPFVADAAEFRCLPMSGRSEVSMLNRIAESMRSSSYKAAHDALEADLKSRQPQTFGVKATLMLMAGSSIQIDGFVKENTADFAKLRIEEADGLLRTFEKRSSKYSTPEKLPQEVQDALKPLLAAREQQQDELIKSITDAPTLQSVHLTSNDTEMLGVILRRLIKADADRGKQLYEKLTLLFMGEDRRQNRGSSDPESGQLANWLRECAGIAPLFSSVMKRAELEGIDNSSSWLRSVENKIMQNEQLSDAGYVTTLLTGSAMVEDVERFRSYPLSGENDGSILNCILRYAVASESVKKALHEQFAKTKPTFGSQLINACLEEEPQVALVAFVKQQEKQIMGMNETTRASLTAVLEKKLVPLKFYAKDLPALALILEFQQKRAAALSETILAARDRNALYRIHNDDVATSYDMVFISQFDPTRAGEVVKHVLKLKDAEDAQNTGNALEWKYGSRFIASLRGAPALWSFMATEAEKRKLSTNDNWRGSATCSGYLNGHEKDTAFITDMFERSGLFDNAETYNPLPGLGGSKASCLLEELVRSFERDRNREPIRAILRKHIDAQLFRTFGMELVRALVDEDDQGTAMKELAKNQAAQFVKLPKEALPMVYAAAAVRSSVLSDPTAVPPEVGELFKAFMDKQRADMGSFKDKVMADKPFADFKMDTKAFEEEFRRGLATFMRTADFDGGAAYFDKGMRIMEMHQLKAGWRTISNGWTLRSEMVDEMYNSMTVSVFVFGQKLFHEDDSGLLSHSGWHHDYNWGLWMRNRWEFLGGRASATEGANGLVNEIARYLKPGHATLVPLGFHNLFTRLTLSDAGAITVWAEREKAVGVRGELLRELAAAGRLFLTGCADGAGHSAAVAISRIPVMELLWKHYRSAIFNDKINPRVRVALAHHLCNVCPLAVPADIVMKATQLAASENKQLHAITGFQLAHIVRRFVRLPVDDEWKRTAQELWDGWTRRQSFAKEKRERGRFYGVLYDPTFAMLQVAARARNERWMTQLIEKDATYLKTMRTTVALLATSGWEEKAAEFLKKEAAMLHNWEAGIVKWEPGFEKHAAALAKACQDPGLSLFGELIIAEAQDYPLPIVRAFQDPQTVGNRITALAPRVANTAFKDEKLRTMAATIVSNYAPRAAAEHLAGLLGEASKKIDITEFAMIRENAPRYEMAYTLSTPLVKRTQAGDAESWKATFETLAGITGSDAYLAGYARNRLTAALADSISAHWQAGVGRDVKLWQPLLLPIIQEGDGKSDEHTGQCVSLLMPLLASSGETALADWRKTLTRADMSTLMSALRKQDDVWLVAGRIAGSEEMKTRQTVTARLNLTTQLLADDVIASRNGTTLFDKIISEAVLSQKEVAEHAEALFSALALKSNHAITLSEICMNNGKPEMARKVLDAALSAKPAPFADQAFNLLEMRFGVEVRTGLKKEAMVAFAKLEAHEKAAARKFTMPILKRLLDAMK